MCTIEYFYIEQIYIEYFISPITIKWRQKITCHYWYFLDKEFEFQPDVCSECHDVWMMSMNLSNIPFLNIHDVDYRWSIYRFSKSEAVNLLQNADLNVKKMEHYEIPFFFIVYKKRVKKF